MLWYVVSAVVVCGAYIFYTRIIKPMSYWKKRNVPYSKPLPLLGSSSSVIFRKKSFVEQFKDIYNKFPESRYSGVFALMQPFLLIRDPQLIKQVTIKDFDHFVNHTSSVNEDAAPLLTRNLTSLQGQKWHDMRSTLSPSFTSSKMKFMFTLLSECAEQFTTYFLKQDSEIASIEMKDTFSRFTNDAIATAAFGVTVDSLKDKENEFFVMAKDSTSIKLSRSLISLGYLISPVLMKLLRIPLFPSHIAQFFIRIVKETIEVRESKGVIRPDMIHLLLEARKGKLSKEESTETSDTGFAVVKEPTTAELSTNQKRAITAEDITAQAILFFLAGFEVTSTLMSFMSHELAVNPDVQERLQNEIDETLERCGGQVTYEHLLGMKYLDMVVSESLRKWPPVVALDRVCEKDYVIKPELPTEEPVVIKKGLPISIPVGPLHYDPKYFPNPQKFDPDRFSDENKSNIVPFTYLPFGVGPRSCIASRFALMKTKILFFHLLSKFDLVPTEKTCIPLELSKKQPILAPDGGFWLGLQKRKVKS